MRNTNIFIHTYWYICTGETWTIHFSEYLPLSKLWPPNLTRPSVVTKPIIWNNLQIACVHSTEKGGLCLMKFFNETLQNAIFWNTKDSVFSYIILHYFIFPNYSHEVKKKEKRKKKKLYGVSLFRILKCFARIFQRTKTANSWRVYRWKKIRRLLLKCSYYSFQRII